MVAASAAQPKLAAAERRSAVQRGNYRDERSVPPSEITRRSCDAVFAEIGGVLLRLSFAWKKQMLGDRLMVGLQSLDLPIGVRIPVSQPAKSVDSEQ